jgi:hypothetical protein
VCNVANYDMLCWYCFNTDLRPSLPRWYDFLICHLFPGRRPFRCRNCRGRQWLRYSDYTEQTHTGEQ